MSVHYHTGDLLSFERWNVCFQSCNAQRVMGSGLAKAIRDRWPAVYDTYAAGSMELGTFTVVEVEPGKRVVSAITQERFGADGRRYVNYEALYSALETLRDALLHGESEGRGPYSLGVPYLLSSDRAGGSFPVVEAMLQSLYAGSTIPCYIVALPLISP